MTEPATATTEDAEEWVIDRLFGEDPVPGPPQPHEADSSAKRPPTPAEEPTAVEPADDDVTNAGARRTALWLGVGVGAAALLIVAAFAFGGSPSHPETSRQRSASASVAAAPRTSAALPTPDQSIPFTAAAPGCKTGSTPAQSLSDGTGASAWVCVRGTPDEQADGQVLHIDFRCDATRPTSACSYLLTSVSVTPGAVTGTAAGHDDWLAHRVVSRLQYNFYNGNELVDILTQDTGNVHGPATARLQRPVLASRVVVIILQTARPPVSPPIPNPGAAPPQTAGADPVAPADDTTVPMPAAAVSDPVDAAFAVSGMQFYGHSPS